MRATRLDRRHLLRGAGLAAAASGGIALLGEHPAGAQRTPSATIRVTQPPYGAAGDGRTDDRAAIQRALDDAGEGRAAVAFPPGDYLVRGPLAPRSRTLIRGCHVPRWEGTATPDSACRIRMAPDFDGPGLIVPPGDSAAVRIEKLALVGGEVGKGLHGIRLADLAEVPAESSWSLEDVTIAGFSGDGIHGRLWVGILDSCFIHSNHGWGINASAGNRWNDVHVANCFLFLNRLGNLYLGGPEPSGGIDFVNTRFERAGTNPDDVQAPLASDSPGVRLASAGLVEFVNCSTDANTGNGIEVVHESDTPDFKPDRLTFTGCRMVRDGTGDGTTLGEFAGVKVAGLNPVEPDAKGVASDNPDVPNRITFVGCVVVSGTADDDGEGEVSGPRYGVWYENSAQLQWVGGSVTPSPAPEGVAYHDGAGGNSETTIVDPERGLLTLPLTPPSGDAPPEGAVYLDETSGELRVRLGGRWRSANLA